MNRKRRTAFLSCLLATALTLTSLPLHAQEAPDTSYTVEDCTRIDGLDLRQLIEDMVLETIQNSTRLNIDTVVADSWQATHMSAYIDANVQAKVERFKEDTGWWTEMLTGWNVSKAQEVATLLANDVFTSTQHLTGTATIASLATYTTSHALFGDAMEVLTTDIGARIAKRFSEETTRAATTALLCLAQHVSENYSPRLFEIYVQTSGSVVDQNVPQPNPAIERTLRQKGISIGVAGFAAILVTSVGKQVAQKITQTLAKRLAGKVVSRVLGKAGASFIPIVGWIVGFGLLIYDIWDARHGALDQIREALSDDKIDTQIKTEVAEAIRQGLPEERSIIALQISNTLLDDWKAFKDEHHRLFEIAETETRFANILRLTPLASIDDLEALVSAFDEWVGQGELKRALDQRLFDRLIPNAEDAAAILADTRSVTETVGWVDLVDEEENLLDLITDLHIHTQALPDELNRDGVLKLACLEEPRRVSLALSLLSSDTHQLLDRDCAEIIGLVDQYSLEELEEFLRDERSPTPTATPTREPPTATPEPETITPTTTPSPEPPVAPSGGQGWLFVLLALAVAGGIGGALIGEQRRKSSS